MSTDKDKPRKSGGEKAARKDGEDNTGLFGRLFGRRRKEAVSSEPDPESKPVPDAAPAAAVENKESEDKEGQKESPAEASLDSEVAAHSLSSPAAEEEAAAETAAEAARESAGEVSEKAAAKGSPAKEPPATAVEEPAPPAPEKAAVAPEAEVAPEAKKETEVSSPPPPAAAEPETSPPAPVSEPAPEAPVEEAAPKAVADPGKSEKKGLFSRLKQGLAKTRKQFVGTLDNLLYGDKEIDEEFLEELEEILLTSDLGVKTSYRLFAEVEEKVSHKELENPAHLRRFLQQEIGAILKQAEAPWEITEKPYVIMTIGVNGVGKTTTIGKLASIFTKQKKKVVLGAADTFRAAAVEQLTVWAERAKVPIIKQNMGADPAAVAFDSLQSAIKREADIVIIDTAGRLHTKVNLMDELKKIKRVLGKALPGAPHEVLLVLDANTGQNAITQAQMFNEAIGVTGLIMTKLDGTAKGGVIVGVCDELKVPVRYIGIGESIRDLRPFDASDFVDALFDRS